MLAGTVYFYKNKKVIHEMDMDDFDELTEEEFLDEIKNTEADKVILISYSNNHQIKGTETILYEEKK